MQCGICGNIETKVIDSREAEGGASIRRRRVCPKCGHRFSTLERVEILKLIVEKKDGRREPYSREKLETGVRRALEKRPVPETRVRKLIASIERALEQAGREEVTSREVGELVMKELRALDGVAYIRFASVYKSFRDADTFEQELRSLKKHLGAGKKGARRPGKAAAHRKKRKKG